VPLLLPMIQVASNAFVMLAPLCVASVVQVAGVAPAPHCKVKLTRWVSIAVPFTGTLTTLLRAVLAVGLVIAVIGAVLSSVAVREPTMFVPLAAVAVTSTV
jgi:hypothetical protein